MEADRAITEYLIFKNSTIINAAAPIIGGINCPPVEAAASVAPANSGLYPTLFIKGIVTEPVPTVFATELPDTVPWAALAITAAFAGPPVALPVKPTARLVIQS